MSYYSWTPPVYAKDDNDDEDTGIRCSSPLVYGEDNPISGMEIYVPNRPNTDMGIIRQLIGNFGGYANKEYFDDMYRLKKENAVKIHGNDKINASYDKTIRPMMKDLYGRFKEDIINENRESYIYKHHIDYERFKKTYEKNKMRPDDIVVDYIAGMTDDYFIDLYREIFGENDVMKEVKYIGYFD